MWMCIKWHDFEIEYQSVRSNHEVDIFQVKNGSICQKASYVTAHPPVYAGFGRTGRTTSDDSSAAALGAFAALTRVGGNQWLQGRP